jgi:hypothetical protein
VTGAHSDRRELLKLLKALAAGDVVRVTRIDRLARAVEKSNGEFPCAKELTFNHTLTGIGTRIQTLLINTIGVEIDQLNCFDLLWISLIYSCSTLFSSCSR